MGTQFKIVNTDFMRFWFFHKNVWIIMCNCVGVRLILFSFEGAGTTDETNCLCNYAGGGCNVSYLEQKFKNY